MHSIFDTQKLEMFRKKHKLDPYRVRQVFLEIFKHSIIDFEQITTLSKSLREEFKRDFRINTLQVDDIVEWHDTTKFLFRTDDNKTVEAVLMYHYNKKQKHDPTTATTPASHINRITLCISTQIWCSVWCIFCVTGKLWLTRNLRMDEMMSQIIFCNNYISNKLGKKEDDTRRKIRNIVYMWMWEPFLNYDNVMATIPYVSEPKYLGLSNKRITISTSGITDAIYKFAKDNPPAALAFSLHAPNQWLREKLVPFAKTFHLDDLMNALDYYTKQTGNEVFYEYVLIKGNNDSDELANETWKLLRCRKAHLNLIAYNQNPVMKLEEPSRNRIMKFKDIVESYSVMVTVRGNMWRKSKGACGQLGRDALNNDTFSQS